MNIETAARDVARAWCRGLIPRALVALRMWDNLDAWCSTVTALTAEARA